MEPIVLIHGFSAESEGTDPEDIKHIYGSLPDALRMEYGDASVVEIDLGRYISLDDGVTVDDISACLNRVLESSKFSHLLDPGTRFNVIIHSTGALVVRNWIRRHWNAETEPKCPVKRLIHLAGANLGSGWGHIGKTQLAKWIRVILGDEGRGIGVLNALELGSDWTLNLHLDLLDKLSQKVGSEGPMEFCMIGSQAPPSWFIIPFRYGKEDGSDGVVRVSASNLNFNYVRIEPSDSARALSPSRVKNLSDDSGTSKGKVADPNLSNYYEIKDHSIAGEDRPEIPFAVLFNCAHSGGDVGIVSGSDNREQVLNLIRTALSTDLDTIDAARKSFGEATIGTYEMASKLPSKFFPECLQLIDQRRQYDKHAQVIFRICDQNGTPLPHFSIYFNSKGGSSDANNSIDTLFEDKHSNEISPNIITFYLRTTSYDQVKGWVERVPYVHGCTLEIDAQEPDSDYVFYLPLQLTLSEEDLVRWIGPNRTTIVDVRLLRVPLEDVFILKTMS